MTAPLVPQPEELLARLTAEIPVWEDVMVPDSGNESLRKASLMFTLAELRILVDGLRGLANPNDAEITETIYRFVVDERECVSNQQELSGGQVMAMANVDLDLQIFLATDDDSPDRLVRLDDLVTLYPARLTRFWTQPRAADNVARSGR